jgi:CheY-like chemotaxis protein
MTDLAGKRVLVVEDEPIVAMFVEDMLAELGAETVGPATSLDKALEFARCASFDAAILDMNINGARSRDVALALERRGIPFVFATGYGAESCEDLGQAALLEKPFRIDQVKEALIGAMAASTASEG